MASKAPPIPPEQRGFGGRKADVESASDKQPAKRGLKDLNLKEQGAPGNIHQNTHNQGYQQDR